MQVGVCENVSGCACVSAIKSVIKKILHSKRIIGSHMYTCTHFTHVY